MASQRTAAELKKLRGKEGQYVFSLFSLLALLALSTLLVPL